MGFLLVLNIENGGRRKEGRQGFDSYVLLLDSSRSKKPLCSSLRQVNILVLVDLCKIGGIPKNQLHWNLRSRGEYMEFFQGVDVKA